MSFEPVAKLAFGRVFITPVNVHQSRKGLDFK